MSYPQCVDDISGFHDSFHNIGLCADERRSCEFVAAADLATSSGSTADPYDLLAIDDVRTVLRQREERLAFDMLQMGRGLEADLAALGSELQCASKEITLERRRFDGRSKRCLSAHDYCRQVCLQRPIPGSLQRRRLLAVAWLVWLCSVTESRSHSPSRAAGSESIAPGVAKDRGSSPAVLAEMDQTDAAGVAKGTQRCGAKAYDVGERGAVLAGKLREVESTLAAKDPALAMLVGRLGGMLLSELEDASASLDVAYRHLAQGQSIPAAPHSHDAQLIPSDCRASLPPPVASLQQSPGGRRVSAPLPSASLGSLGQQPLSIWSSPRGVPRPPSSHSSLNSLIGRLQ